MKNLRDILSFCDIVLATECEFKNTALFINQEMQIIFLSMEEGVCSKSGLAVMPSIKFNYIL